MTMTAASAEMSIEVSAAASRQLIDTLEEVAVAYGLSARLLSAPADDELITHLADTPLLDEWPACHCEESVRGVASIRRSLREGESLEALAVDYRQLLVEASAPVPTPYESAYRPAEELHFTPAVVDVVGDHHVYGLAPRPGSYDEDEQLGRELALAGRLCLAAREALLRGEVDESARCLALHRDLLEQNLRRWAVRCLREIESAAVTHFYRGAAELALSVLTCAHERLS
jgi:TorA maturation chaperone TorD